ncbi:MAG: DNA-directed RNA polymerase subunit alpha [Deltaproteobacteria bacterium]|nr:DNA-directed RNA polymerase subunit alpha [Deltaproteobacteria bacterium]
MYMNWRELIAPEKVLKIASEELNYGKFVCEPLERGFGITIGNALRRIILSSLYGAAIVSVKFDSVMHEYSVVDGVLEDVSEIILNLKEVRLKIDDPDPKTITIDVSGEKKVTAADIVSPDGKTEVLNPEHHIATLSKGASLKMTMTVKVGKGYALAEANKDEDAPIGTLPIDASFSPIKQVKYLVGNARVGQRTDFDKLTMEVWTDGSILPEDTISYAAKILKEQMSIFINFDEDLEPEPQKVGEDLQQKEFNENLYRNVEELELSVRSSNCLKNAEIIKLYQLVQKTEGEKVLGEMGLSFGMKLEGFVVPEEEDIEEGE